MAEELQEEQEEMEQEEEQQEEQEGEQEGEKPKKDEEEKKGIGNIFSSLIRNLGVILYVIGMIVLLVLITFFIYEHLQKDKTISEFPEDVYYTPEEKRILMGEGIAAPLATVEMERLQAPLDDQKTICDVEYSLAYDNKNKNLGTEITEKEFIIRDRILNVISSQDRELIDNAVKRHDYLKPLLLNEINSIMDSGDIQQIYFLKFVMR